MQYMYTVHCTVLPIVESVSGLIERMSSCRPTVGGAVGFGLALGGLPSAIKRGRVVVFPRVKNVHLYRQYTLL